MDVTNILSLRREKEILSRTAFLKHSLLLFVYQYFNFCNAASPRGHVASQKNPNGNFNPNTSRVKTGTVASKQECSSKSMDAPLMHVASP